MRTFKKMNFVTEWKKPIFECACNLTEDETIDELVDGDGAPIDGSVPDGNEAEIQAGPVQQPKQDEYISDYEKGIATTTDDTRAKTSQGPDWQGRYGGFGGTYYSHGHRVNTGSWLPWMDGGIGLSEDLEENMTKMVEKMLTKKEKDDLSVKKVDYDLSKKAKIDDLVDKIKGLNPEDKEKLEKLLSDAKS